ncbi:hypothetical protein WJX73_010215 [Symbiochloris irregularis]|uniref:Glutathione S-transferase n=1 Tax=Symbiochloris irregularis TaxID=706552 RepID=A0AAW1PUI5_9CHLO
MATKILQFWNITPAPGGCPFAQRAWLALEEKKIKYDTHIFSKTNKPKDFLDTYYSLWPDKDKAATVPTIIDVDGTKVTESQVVVEYLEERYKDQGTQLIPKVPAQAATARLFGQLFMAVFSTRNILFSESKQEVEEGKANLVRGLEVLETFLKTQALPGGPFVLGEHYSIAEVTAAPFLWRAALLLPEFRQWDLLKEAKAKGFSRFVEWSQAVLERPSTKDTAIPHDVLIDSFKDRVPKLS